MTSSGTVGAIRSLGVTITTGRSLEIPFASAISAQTMRPNWSEPGIPVPCVPSERLGLLPFKPLLERRGDSGHLRPVDLSRALLGLLLRQELPEQFQVFYRDDGGHIRPAPPDDHRMLRSGNPAHQAPIVLDLLRLIHVVRFTEKRVLRHTTTPDKR